ncbi:MAG: hypothetical protein CME13_11570 [Gemmatimonadetes bacterium]|nr:hypothetical protein [Gemmatimonadota bacterium]
MAQADRFGLILTNPGCLTTLAISSDPPSIEGAQTPKASEGPTDTPRRTSQQNRLRMRMAPGADSPLEICAS